jgi:hypothetical protein
MQCAAHLYVYGQERDRIMRGERRYAFPHAVLFEQLIGLIGHSL